MTERSQLTPILVSGRLTPLLPTALIPWSDAMCGCLDPNAFSITRGTSLALQVEVLDAANDPVPITGATELELRVKERLGSDTAVIDRSMTGNPGQFVITDGPGGVFTVTLDPTDTQDLDPGCYVFAVYVTTPTIGRRQVIGPSTMTIEEAI